MVAVSQRRATWTQVNLLAEAARSTRALRVPDPAARIALLDRVVAAALDQCVALDPPADARTAERYTHTEGIGASAEASAPAYTTWTILAAEARLLAAHDDTVAPTADPQPIHATATARPMPGAPRLSTDQARAAADLAGSGRRLDVLVGAAGTGKTRALLALRAAWELAHGSGSVVGLAPSATAAAELAASLRIGADTLAKWIHESDPVTASGRPWQLRAGQLVILDEAAMASTTHLDHLLTQAVAAGAKVVLVGDHCQLGAIEAGGAFALLAEEGNAVELEQLHRFDQEWEAAATRALRVGNPTSLDAYAAHGRLHDGAIEAMAEMAYRAWAADTHTGLHSLLLAPDRATISALNRRARADRIRDGFVRTEHDIALHDDNAAGIGDIVTTRRNDRRLAHPDRGYVHNGDRWTVTAVHPDGSLDAVALAGAAERRGSAASVRLPADYVRSHVELGYALTVHRAQGVTADTTHLVTGSGMSREALYVGLTRGRHSNHAYVATDIRDSETHLVEEPPTARQVLEAVLRTAAAETSATSALRRRQGDYLLALTRAGHWPPPEAHTARSAVSPAPYRPSSTPGLSR